MVIVIVTVFKFFSREKLDLPSYEQISPLINLLLLNDMI